MAREGNATVVHRSDYSPVPFFIDDVRLTFDLDEQKTRVLNVMRVRRNHWHTGTPSQRPACKASSDAWSKPRSRRRSACNATGTIATGMGDRSRSTNVAMRSASNVPSTRAGRRSPSNLSARSAAATGSR